MVPHPDQLLLCCASEAYSVEEIVLGLFMLSSLLLVLVLATHVVSR